MEEESFIYGTSLKMVQSVVPVHKMCRRIEKEMENGIWNLDSFQELYETIVYMFSFKRFSDRYEEKIPHNAYNVRTPSYMLRMVQGMNELKKEMTPKNLKKYIERYSFLSDFSISPHVLEEEQQLKKHLLSYQPIEVKTKSTEFNPKNKEERIYKRVVWYEELRHFYQLRALRIYRNAFNHFELDIFESTMNDLKEAIEKRGDVKCPSSL